ncbi:hypothetical protein RI367_002950 [Sorochytrium milnesiophthora]
MSLATSLLRRSMQSLSLSLRPATSTGQTLLPVRSLWTFRHAKDGTKSGRYKGMLKAKQRRVRLGKTGGPRIGKASFKALPTTKGVVGFRRLLTFLPDRNNTVYPGFPGSCAARASLATVLQTEQQQQLKVSLPSTEQAKQQQ